MVELDFVVSSADLFSASIRLARTRLIVGLFISLTFIIGLVAFFLVLDEKLILAQTSPLFIGIPLLAVGGQVLRLHASCKQYVRSLPPSQRRMSYSFSVAEASFRVVSGESFSNVSWTDVMKVVEDRKRFLIFFSKFNINVIPKSAFPESVSVSRLRQVLRAKLGTRANLRD